jgi:hypothetical protein
MSCGKGAVNRLRGVVFLAFGGYDGPVGLDASGGDGNPLLGTGWIRYMFRWTTARRARKTSWSFRLRTARARSRTRSRLPIHCWQAGGCTQERSECLRVHSRTNLIRSSTGPRSVRAGLWSWRRPSPNAQLTAAEVFGRLFQGQVVLARAAPIRANHCCSNSLGLTAQLVIHWLPGPRFRGDL